MGTYDISKINNWFNDFTSARNKFNNKYCSDFTNSYIRNCNDSAVINMYNKLNQHYEKIKRINGRVNNIWDDFLFDVQAIDNRLAGQHVNARDSLISSKLSKIQNLEEYESDLNTKISSLSAKVGIVDKIGLAENKSASENFAEVFERCGATVATLATSLLEGVAKLGEDGMDLLVLAGAVKASGYTSMIDLKNYITAEVKGDDSLKTNKTEQLWEDTRSFVSRDFTGFVFNKFYDNTQAGQWMKENAYGFDSVRAVGSEVGEVVGVVVLSTITGGSAAIIYGAAKTAEHTEENWQDQNVSTTGGLLKGMLQGSLDGAFYALGAKGDNIMKAAASSAVKQGEKIVLKKTAILFGKTMFECGCSIVQDESSILVNTIFSNNTIYDVNGEVLEFKNFKDKWNYYYKQAGGDEGLVISMATAGILSFASDAKDVNKIMKNADIDTSGTRKSMGNSKNMDVSSGSKKINSDANIDFLKKEYNELLNKTKEEWFIKAKEAGDNGWAWDLNKVRDADDIVKRMQKLESTLDVKNTGVPESKIYDYSQAKKEADAMVQKIKNKPTPGFENIDTNSSEYKKAMQDMYSKPSPFGKQDLSKVENPFNFSKQSNGVHISKSNVENKINLKQKVNEKISYVLKRKKLKVFADYNGDLKSYISDGMPKKLDPVEKARYIYCKLNNEVSYSNKWNSKKLVAIDEKGIYNKKIDLSNYNGEEIICSNWSEMYSELLRDNGINCAVRGTDGGHRWVVFENNGKYYMADATNKFDKANDLTRMQGGVQSYGFIEITREQAMSNEFANNISEVQNAHKNNKLNVDRMDKKLGFNYKDADKLFSADFKNGNSMKELKYLGLDSNATTIDIIEAKLEKDLFKKMDKMGTMEGLMYFRNRKNAIFTSDEIRNVNDKWIVNKYTGEMCILYKVSGGKNYLYTGKNNIKVVDNEFANNYLNYGFINYS